MRTHPTFYARYGAGLADCFGSVHLNLVKGNGSLVRIPDASQNGEDDNKPSTTAGGGFYGCMDIRRNFIYGNQALHGGGIAVVPSFNWDDPIEAGTNVVTVWGVVQANIIAENTAAIQGGGIYAPRGRIENNTIYGNTVNTSSGMAGVYLEMGLPTGTMNNLVFQNNIVWANEEDGGDTGTPANEVSSSLYGRIVYSAIQHSSDPDASNGNIGPFSSPVVDAAALDFKSATFNESTPNYDTYLHLDEDSVCIDQGQPNQTAYDASSVSNPQDIAGSDFIGRDFDDQLSFIDISSVPNAGPTPPPNVNRVVRDIGSDEYPTQEDGFIFWWEQLGALED